LAHETVKLSRRPSLAAGEKWADMGHETRWWQEGRFIHLVGLSLAVNCIPVLGEPGP